MIETIIIFVCGFALGHKLATLFHVAAFKKILEELGVSEDQLRKLGRRAAEELGVDSPEFERNDGLREIHIKLEQHQGQIYAFRTDTDEFLGQGADQDSLIAHLKQRMTGVRLVVDEGSELLQKSH